MAGRRFGIALLGLIWAAAEARAQFIGPPVPGIPVLVPDGIGFRYRSRHLAVGGFFSTGGYSVGVVPAPGFGPGVGPIFAPGPVIPVYPIPTYGYSDIRQSVQIVVPAVTIAPRPPLFAPEADLSGVDLDRAPSPLHALEGRPKGAPRERIPERREPAPKPKIDKPPVAPPMVPEKKLPRVEESDPLDEGVKAFKEAEFGLAALYFRQAALAAPGAGRPYFLLAQAYMAQGKFRDAFVAIGDGLKKDPAFPDRDFRPRLELYKDMDAEYLRERKTLDDIALERPGEGVFLFLQGYLEWFDGRRDEARKLLLRARPLLADPAVVDRFLKAGDGAVAAR
ncbi:MAG: hypothetical protein U0793_21205 [Gemmataceae bacterium]